jgi:pimeloyl-ACP methyl ester carboxylesterase
MMQTEAVTGKYVSANGLNIHYAEQGSGHPLILLHGGTANLESWEAQLPIFTPHFRVITPDTRGHGKTVNPADGLDYHPLAEDVAAFAGALKLEKPLFFGYSDGGQIALEVGVHFPDIPGALVLGGTLYKFSQPYFDVLKGWGFDAPGVANVERIESAEPEWAEYLKTAHPRADDPDYWRKFMKQISTLWWTPPKYTDDDLKKIKAPTLILVGDRDHGIELEQTMAMYRNIPQCELAMMPNADHGSTVSNFSMPIVLDFLKRHSKPFQN